LKELLKSLLRLSLPKTAFDEFRNIADFQRAGILTMAPVAAGIKRCGLLRTKSFLVSKEIGQCRRLDHLFLKHPTIPVKEKQEVIKKVALIVKHMHARGFNHKDLYLCHILLDSYGNIFLVDLHRVDKRGKVPERWKVKDIAALNYSAIEISASRTERMRFLKTYLGFDRISGPQKSFALKIMKKTEKMIKHNRKECK
jgi:serine/threonine protein kinase